MGVILERLKSISYRSQVLAFFLLLGICSANNVPAIFIFGDSLVDGGNNLYLSTLAKPTFPNGIDFPTGSPSGRYTNGRTVPDLIAQQLGFQNFTPPYLAPTTTGDTILKGVNYASSGAGILNDTGKTFIQIINFHTQISYYEKTRQDIISRIGIKAAKRLLRQSLHIVAIGSNDFLTTDAASVQNNISFDAFFNNLIPKFRFQLTRLYKLDARKIIVVSTGPLGCIPFERDRHPPGDECIASSNKVAKEFNTRLKGMLQELRITCRKAKYLYANIYAIVEEVLQNYPSYGFENADSACCRLAGAHGGLIPCVFFSPFCPDRTKYVFWDAFHATEGVNLIAARRLMDGGLNYISPMNIRQLVNR